MFASVIERQTEDREDWADNKLTSGQKTDSTRDWRPGVERLRMCRRQQWEGMGNGRRNDVNPTTTTQSSEGWAESLGTAICSRYLPTYRAKRLYICYVHIYSRVVCLLKTFSLQQLQQGEVREMWEEGERGVRRKELRLKHNKNSYSFLSIFVWSTLSLGLQLQRERQRERETYLGSCSTTQQIKYAHWRMQDKRERGTTVGK